MSTIIGFTLMICGLPVMVVGGSVLLWWARDRDEYVVFGAMLAFGLAVTLSGAALLA